MRNSKILVAGMMLLALVLGAGCNTTKWQPTLNAPVAPSPSEAVVLEDLIIVFDGSGSMTLQDKYTTAKRFLRSFIEAMPEGNYGVSALSFGGEWKIDWPVYPPQVFDRPSLAVYADELCPIMGSTFLAEALQEYGSELAASQRRTAVLVISDGKAESPAETLATIDYLRDVHPGQLCVYTVQVGDDEAGGQLLYDMAARAGCGRGVHVDTVSSPEGLDAFVREIFFGERVEVEMLGRPGEAKTLLFGDGKSFIRPEYTPLLQEIAQMMEVTPEARLRIEGHTDASGSAESNAALAQQRADAVKRALAERGVAPERMEAIGFGEDRPVQPGAAQINRRVEVIVVMP